MINKKRLLYQLFFIFLFFWVALSVFRTLYNLTKVVVEEQNWITLNDTQKKIKYFGGIYELLTEIEQIHPKSTVGFYTGGREFYLGRYELYPVHAVWYISFADMKKRLRKDKVIYLVVCCSGQKVLSRKEAESLDLTETARNNVGVIFKHE